MTALTSFTKLLGKCTLILSVCFSPFIESVQAGLQNNPIGDKDGLLFATTFSMADNSEQTMLNVFKLENIFFYGGEKLNVRSNYQNKETTIEGFDSDNHSKFQYLIISDPHVLEKSASHPYATKDDKVNRLVFNTPSDYGSGYGLFGIPLKHTIAGSKYTLTMDLELLNKDNSYCDNQKFTLSIDNNRKKEQYLLNEVRTKVSVSYEFTAQENDEYILFRKENTCGIGMAVAVSNITLKGDPKFYIAAESEYVSLDQPARLYAFAKSTEISNIIWYKKTKNDTDWVEFARGVQTATDTPTEMGTILYKAQLGETVSDIVSVSCIVACNKKITPLFVDDFGILENEKARNNSEWVDNLSLFRYVEACKQLKGTDHNDYAVVANPKWCGCGDYGEDYKTCNCESDDPWFYAKYDHTQGGEVNGKYGGMLIINPKQQSSSEIIVYSRPIETICKNTFVNFSVWFANPSVNSDAPVSTELRVKDANGDYIPEATIKIKDILPNKAWQYAVTSFNTGSNTSLTVEIWNMSAGSNVGNDLLIDDIMVVACPPEGVLFATAPSSKYTVSDTLVTGPCNGEVTLAVKGSSITTLFANPYFLWVRKGPDDTEFKICPQFDSSRRQQAVLGNDTIYKTIVAENETEALKYFYGTGGTCNLASETNAILVKCTPITARFVERSCNNVTLEASREALWYMSDENKTDWVLINDEPGTAISFEMKEDSTYFKAVATDTGDESDIINLEYYSPIAISAYLNLEPTMYVGGDTISAEPDDSIRLECTYEYDVTYSFYQKVWQSGVTTLIGTVTPAQGGEINWPLVKPTENCSYYIERDGCMSDSVHVKMIASVILIESSRNCNEVTLQAVTEEDEVMWYSSTKPDERWTGPLTNQQGEVIKDKTLNVTITNDTVFKAVIEFISRSGASRQISSNFDTIQFYHASISGGLVDDVILVNDTIFAKKTDDLKLKVDADAFSGESAEYLFTDKSGAEIGVILQENINKDSIVVNNVTANDEFIVTVAGCSTNSIVLIVQDTIHIPVEPDDPRSATAVVRNRCNDITITADASTDNVYWFSSADGQNWNAVQDGAIIGKVLKTELTENGDKLFRAAVKVQNKGSKQEVFLYSNSVKTEFYKITQIGNIKDSTEVVTDTIIAKRGYDIELRVKGDSYASDTAKYIFRNKRGEEIGTIEQSNIRTEFISVENVQESNEFFVNALECAANSIVLVVQDTIHIPVEPDDPRSATAVVRHNCNDITITADASTDKVYWFSSADGQNWEAVQDGKIIGKELNATITEDTYFKAGVKIIEAGKRDSVFTYSNDVKVEFYHIAMEGNIKGSATIVNDTIFAKIGDDVQIRQTKDSYAGQKAAFMFWNSEDVHLGTLYYKCATCTDIDIPNVQKRDIYKMNVLECVANPLVLIVQDTIHIPVDPDDPRSATAIVRHDCNEMTITAEASTNEVYWFSSSDGQTWKPVDGGAVVGKVFRPQLIEGGDLYFRAAVKVQERGSEQEVFSYSNTIKLEYYSLEMNAYPVDKPEKKGKSISVDYNSSIVLELTDKSSAGEGAEYIVYNADNVEVGRFNPAQGVRTITISDLTEDQTYYVKVKECQSALVHVSVNGSVQLTSSRVCNEATLRATVVGRGEVSWYVNTNGNWTKLSNTGKELKLQITENIKVKASIGSFESNVIELSYYETSLIVTNTETSESGTEIEVGLGAEVVFTPALIGFENNPDVIYYDMNGKVAAQRPYDDPELVCSPSTDRYYYISVSSCVTGKAGVKVIWPTVFTPLTPDGYNDTFVMDVDPAIEVMVYDRTGNMMVHSMNGWDGTVNGNFVQPGVYYYVAKLSDGTIRKSTIEVYQK